MWPYWDSGEPQNAEATASRVDPYKCPRGAGKRAKCFPRHKPGTGTHRTGWGHTPQDGTEGKENGGEGGTERGGGGAREEPGDGRREPQTVMFI